MLSGDMRISIDSSEIALSRVGPCWVALGVTEKQITFINQGQNHPEITRWNPISPKRSLNEPNHTQNRPIRPTDFSLGMIDRTAALLVHLRTSNLD